MTLEFSNYLGSSYWEAREIGGGIKEFDLRRQVSYGLNFREVKKIEIQSIVSVEKRVES